MNSILIYSKGRNERETEKETDRAIRLQEEEDELDLDGEISVLNISTCNSFVFYRK